MNKTLKYSLAITAAVAAAFTLQACTTDSATVIGHGQSNQGRYVCSAYNHRTKVYYRGFSRISRRAARRQALVFCRSSRFPGHCVISGRRPCRIIGPPVHRGLYVCSIHNLKTDRLFVGRSPSRLRAISRARGHCEKGRFAARCSMHVRCHWNRR